ncbi:hypothetical protein [Kitasatospora sp. NPDC047058]|uniref:hypothetical protein n=1 Tax=Kitasatospora sp. NPDC047058 TaxID=3155620 RepID=UPI0033D75370
MPVSTTTRATSPEASRMAPLKEPRKTSRRAARVAAASVLCLAVAAATAAPAVAAGSGHDGKPQRGALVSATRVADLDAGQATAYVQGVGFTTAPAAQDGVEVHRLTYRTVDATGRPTVASGVVALPRNAAGRHPRGLTTVEYTHGTLPYRGYAASVSDGPDRAVTVMFAGAGFAAVAPDYLGLGVGTGPHPYLDVESETTAAVDLLAAARTFAARNGVALDGRVMATGFSQGGPAALGLGRALQAGALPGARLAALAPVSGPYDLRGAELPAAFDGRLAPPTAVFYLAYAVTAWNRLHHLYDSPAEAFRAPYADTVEALFDGGHTDEQIVAALPGTPEELLTPRFIDRLKHPAGTLARILRTADSVCTDWTPRAPVRLYSGGLDRDVAVANTESCRRALAAHGVDAPVVETADADHNGSALASYPAILAWFRGFAATGR